MNQRSFHVLALLFMLVFTTSKSFGQTFENTYQKFADNYVPERIHLHLDKSTYAAGDTIWFKAYLMSGIVPAELSKSLYLDWTDAGGKLIHRSSAPIVSGISFGQVAIPEKFTGNVIHVKAYTKWMLNFDSSFLYNRDIPVISTKVLQKKKTTQSAEFNLFPEGGNLVYGVPSKVAFKGTDGFGNPIHVSVRLMMDGKLLESSKDRHDGMGYFYFKPEKGRQYEVIWKDPSGKEHTESLPSISESGVVMQVSFAPGKRILLLKGGGNESTGTYRIIGTMFRQQVFNILRTMNNGLIEASIPVNTLPSGILRITVLDNLFHPVAERITFINNNEYSFKSDMEVAHWGLNKRAKNELEISVQDSLTANLSVSVTDARLDFDTTQNIITDLLLTGDIKGKVYNPAFYFMNTEDSTQDMLDLVMLTNGWRKIGWEEIAAGKLPEIKFPRDTSYLTVSGRLYGATPMQLQNAGDIILIVNQKNKSEWMMAPVGADGRFDVKDFLLFDTATVYYQPPKGKGLKNVSVQFSEKRLPVTSITPAREWGSFDTSSRSLQYLLSQQWLDEMNFRNAKILETVTIKAKTKSREAIMDEKYTSGLFSGGDAKSFDLVNDPTAAASMSIFTYLQGRVAGVMITPDNPPTITWRGGSPALFLDEMPVTTDFLSTIPVSDIAYVKVLNPPFMGATGGGGNGAIAVYTRRGDDIQYAPGKGLSRNTITGYSVLRQFYSPNYEMTSPELKDLRTTLYWNPEVMIGPGKNKVTLKFFNNDVTGSFRVVIEGMSTDGKLTRTVKIME